MRSIHRMLLPGETIYRVSPDRSFWYPLRLNIFVDGDRRIVLYENGRLMVNSHEVNFEVEVIE